MSVAAIQVFSVDSNGTLQVSERVQSEREVAECAFCVPHVQSLERSKRRKLSAILTAFIDHRLSVRSTGVVDGRVTYTICH